MMKSNHGMGMSNADGPTGDPSKLTHGISKRFIENMLVSHAGSTGMASTAANLAKLQAQHDRLERSVEASRETQSDTDWGNSRVQRKSSAKRQHFTKLLENDLDTAATKVDRAHADAAGVKGEALQAREEARRATQDLKRMRSGEVDPSALKQQEAVTTKRGGSVDSRESAPVMQRATPKNRLHKNR